MIYIRLGRPGREGALVSACLVCFSVLQVPPVPQAPGDEGPQVESKSCLLRDCSSEQGLPPCSPVSACVHTPPSLISSGPGQILA